MPNLLADRWKVIRPHKSLPTTSPISATGSAYRSSKPSNVVAVHRDNAPVSGKSTECRPGLAALLDGIKSRNYDSVLVESLSLIGLDLPALVSVLTAMKAANLRLIARREAIEAADGGADGLLDAAERFADHPRFAKRERILAGQHHARQAGVKFERPSISEKQIARVRAVLATGAGVREAGRLTGVSATSMFPNS